MSLSIGSLERRIGGVLLGLLVSWLSGQAQFEETYTPIRLSGQVPKAVRTEVGDRTDAELALDAGGLGRRKGKEYYTLSNYALSEALRSGEVYFNDEVSTYLSTIVDTLLRDEPELRPKITVYATRIGIPNANCWRDGTIFFNLPLLTYLESEAQVAFILAHEIAHYRKQHVLNQFRKVQEVKGEAFRRQQDAEAILEVLRFSREQESEADLLGFDLILRSPYDPGEALGALETMQAIDEPSDGEILDLPELFGLPDFSPLDSCACDTARIRGKVSEKVTYKLSITGDFESGGVEEKEDPKEDAAEEDDDALATHPDLETRIEALVEKLIEMGSIDTRASFLLGEERFRRIQDIAYFEHIEKMFQRADYMHSLYGALRMLSYFPDNQYLHEMAAKNLYWLAFYDDRDLRLEVFMRQRLYENLSYGSFACGLRRLFKADFRELVETFIADRAARYPESGPLMMLQGQIAELQEQPQAAQQAYQSYLDAFPDGKYQPFVSYRLQQLNP